MIATEKDNIAARAARWSVRHRRTAILGWLGFVVLAVAAGMILGTKNPTDADLANGETRAAVTALDAHGMKPGASEYVLVQSSTLTARDAEFRATVDAADAAVSHAGAVRNVRSPYTAGNTGMISRDGHSALVQFGISGDPVTAHMRVGPALDAVAAVQRAHPAMRVAEYGDASLALGLKQTVDKDFSRLELFSLPVTLVILVVAFGALFAAGVPLLFAVSGVMGATGLMAFTSHLIPVNDSAGSVVLLIGLAVGVDYTLFYIRREREERAAGRGPQAALLAAAATSGHSVLISGLTVLVAMAGMFFTGDATFTGIASATMLVVALAVVGSLTVLPAVLSKLGDRIEKGHIPGLSRRREVAESGRFWGSVVGGVLRRPRVAVAVAGGALVALAIPALSLHTDLNSTGDVPQSLAVVQTYNRMQAAFPGGPAPAQVVIEASDVTSPQVTAAVDRMVSRALATRQMQQPIQVQVSADHQLALVSIPLAGDGQDAVSNRALDTLRHDVIPATVGAVPGTSVNVGGVTASTKDFNDLLGQRAPLVFGFVLGLAFVLLLVAFRAPVVAVTAIVLNMLSVAAAYGLLVAVFQWGWGEHLLGFHSTHSVVAWLPLFLFVILFGLSMDYHVFILSRIREAYDRGMGTERAIAHGIRSTAGVVTTAAVVMVVVFGLFATLSQVSMKELGLGLGAAVLIDATVVRTVLLPATMRLLGERNWWTPSWARRARPVAVPQPAMEAEPVAA